MPKLKLAKKLFSPYWENTNNILYTWTTWRFETTRGWPFK